MDNVSSIIKVNDLHSPLLKSEQATANRNVCYVSRRRDKVNVMEHFLAHVLTSVPTTNTKDKCRNRYEVENSKEIEVTCGYRRKRLKCNVYYK